METIPWSIDNNNDIENDFLLTGCSSILKSIECGIALANIIDQTENIEKWKKLIYYYQVQFKIQMASLI